MDSKALLVVTRQLKKPLLEGDRLAEVSWAPLLVWRIVATPVSGRSNYADLRGSSRRLLSQYCLLTISAPWRIAVRNDTPVYDVVHLGPDGEARRGTVPSARVKQ